MEEEKPKKRAIKLGTLTMEKLEEINAIYEKSDKKDMYKSQIDEKMTVAQYQEEHKQTLHNFMETKVITSFDFNHLTLTIDEIKQLPTDELLKLLSGESHKGAIHDSIVQLISNEILSREIKEASKPHWTVTPTFIVGCIASVLAAISILVTIYFSVFYKAENNNKHTNQSYAIGKNSNPK